jgi:glycosyltransferase involved in cell wall biosynthesis
MHAAAGAPLRTALAADGRRVPEATGAAPLRILMVAPQPFFQPRGTPFSILHRVRALTRAGHRIDLVTYPFGEDVTFEGLRILRCRRPPLVRHVKIGPSVAKLALDVPLFAATVRALRENQYDVLHSHEEASFFSGWLARRYGLRHVYDMHSSLPQQLRNFSAYNLRLIRWSFELLERRVLRTADGVITICTELADLVERECPTVTHAMIENTADNAQVFARSFGDVRAELGLQDRQIILYTGTFEAYQGLDLLLRAFANLRPDHPQARLVMVGGRPEQIENYRERAKTLGIEDAARFIGQVHPSRIQGFLAAADLIVSPRSRGTNTPLKIYEYLRSGRPLVATAIRSHTQTLDDEIAYLVQPTAEDLARGIGWLLGNSELRRRLGRAAAKRADERFSDGAYLAKVRRFYDDLIAADRMLPARSPGAARGEPLPHLPGVTPAQHP